MKADKHRILVVDDDARQRDMLSAYLGTRGFDSATAETAGKALERLESDGNIDLVISDIRMPGMSGLEFYQEARSRGHSQPFLFITAYPDVKDAVTAMRDGAVDYIEKPVALDEMLDLARSSLHMDVLEDGAPELDLDIPEWMVARSKRMLDVLKDAALIAPSDVSVLIHGESGAGKEVLADLIHAWSDRSEKPFLKINCAAIPENLLESELFGYEKGAFTGAGKKREGLFERADGGTILLDEIAEMPQGLQSKLLRVTENGSFIPLGGGEERSVDVRILAATNKNLMEEVERKNFREDLYYRLETFELRIAPLRERREDILPLADAFLAKGPGGGGRKKKLSDAAADCLLTYDWPGNARELRNATKRAALMTGGGDVILPEHLPERILKSQAVTIDRDSDEGVIDQMERTIILRTLEKNNYNRSRTAEELKMSRRTLTFKLRRLKDAGFDV
jgi:DNA-binding NtrC family response regulator